MSELLLIGAGQLGSRHLQGLSRVPGDNRIFVIDPSRESLVRAESRLTEVTDRNTKNLYSFQTSFDSVSENIDLVIVATNSDVRREALDSCISRGKFKNLILEKFLFQKKEDFFEVQKTLKTKNITAWVNCARREFPEFQTLKEKFRGNPIQEVSVSGSNWGMGCNSIHFVDLISYLSDSIEYTLEGNDLMQELYETKRVGYIEFLGSIQGKFDKGPHFTITSTLSEGQGIQIFIKSATFSALIFQSEQRVLFLQKDGENQLETVEPFLIHYQSDLTCKVVTSILETGKCNLTKYDESAKLHMPLFDLFLNHYKKISGNLTELRCPIT
ncbi:hypothetical protein CH373_12315 [Leptospira perolatii]|uniref:Gfo/Idh/MocA-like oxidoreductase N-terminal domain-containing protein n=1 Tax=Leptospira perolatii TaxID=2023191 RepID=A0A2M9ZL94_9LEPT|nr:Gfo/Idh/MocA family oxidoreductase [Leptospira perolatii]PJZ70278.1 hypothetical protein CH360_06655 [Leptospira perolatii]PJZ72838.1 hypothetical protein CH373_12315 [Leptospira perolatii]